MWAVIESKIHMFQQLSLITPDERQKMLEAIMVFFEEERGEELGVIAAEEVLDFFLEQLGPTMYRAGVAAAEAQLEKSMAGLKMELELLRQS